MNLRRIVTHTVNNNKYFKIFDGGEKLLDSYLESNLTNYNHLKTYYQNKIIIKNRGLYEHTGELATVLRYEPDIDNNKLAFCKLKNKELYFFVYKGTITKWIKRS